MNRSEVKREEKRLKCQCSCSLDFIDYLLPKRKYIIIFFEYSTVQYSTSENIIFISIKYSIYLFFYLSTTSCIYLLTSLLIYLPIQSNPLLRSAKMKRTKKLWPLHPNGPTERTTRETSTPSTEKDS